MSERIERLLKGLQGGRVSMKTALAGLKHFPYYDIGFAKIDSHRALRRGFPEVIFGKGKTPEQIISIAKKMAGHGGTILITRSDRKVFLRLKKIFPRVKFEKSSGAIYLQKTQPAMKKGTVLIITAGTADLPVAEEARVTLELMGNKVETLYDVGVAGIHRLLDKKVLIELANVLIVIAGMEGALASVVSGLVSKPVIAVPTSVGYGASFGGIAALLAMMNSCSPGVAVVNIDNGFGAGYLASLINS